MAKKGLAALASKQINSTKETAPAQSSTGAKRGRKPAETTTSDEVNVTFKLPKVLVRRMKQFIIDYEAEGYGKLTQKDIVIKGVVYALDRPEIMDIEVNI